ncbi:MAG: mobile element transfer protein SpdA, partial [Streptosporangiaceae bacterium]|nr:mobile element transfer protein SpdA [Streptosporangiaceae bacterium]
RILVAGWPAVAFLGGTLLDHTAPATAEPEPEPEPETVELVRVEQEPEQPAPHVPAALVEHARKVAAEHHARTGTPIDAPTLRARLGVPAPLAEAIATRL